MLGDGIFVEVVGNAGRKLCRGQGAAEDSDGAVGLTVTLSEALALASISRLVSSSASART
jgi:hypothetical protein